MSGEIPLMDGANIVKESLLQGSGRFELDVGPLRMRLPVFNNQII